MKLTATVIMALCGLISACSQDQPAQEPGEPDDERPPAGKPTPVVDDENETGKRRKVILEHRVQPRRDRDVVLRVSAGVLPQGSRINVYSDDGKILGSVVPFGVAPDAKAGIHTIPFPERSIKEGKAIVHVEFLEPDGESVRMPTAEEVEKLELVVVPITPQ